MTTNGHARGPGHAAVNTAGMRRLRALRSKLQALLSAGAPRVGHYLMPEPVFQVIGAGWWR
jgi:hypothetical protein